LAASLDGLKGWLAVDDLAFPAEVDPAPLVLHAPHTITSSIIDMINLKLKIPFITLPLSLLFQMTGYSPCSANPTCLADRKVLSNVSEYPAPTS
jgi:hypothetical protein